MRTSTTKRPSASQGSQKREEASVLVRALAISLLRITGDPVTLMDLAPPGGAVSEARAGPSALYAIALHAKPRPVSDGGSRFRKLGYGQSHIAPFFDAHCRPRQCSSIKANSHTKTAKTEPVRFGSARENDPRQATLLSL